MGYDGICFPSTAPQFSLHDKKTSFGLDLTDASNDMSLVCTGFSMNDAETSN